MTESSHIYRAYLNGDLDRELSVRGGKLTLDAGVAPHVEGTISIAPPGHWEHTGDYGSLYPEFVPGDDAVIEVVGTYAWVSDTEIFESIDPRESPRIRIDVEAEFPSGTQTRSFDLGIRDAAVGQDSVLELELASDESILTDYAPLADDTTPRSHEASLRDIVNYVLDKTIPGAELEAGTTNADLTAAWTLQNSIPNPFGLSGGLPVWLPAGNCTMAYSAGNSVLGDKYVIATSSGAGQFFIRVPQSVNTKKGDTWTFSAYMHRDSSAALNGILRVYEMDAADTILRQVESPPTALVAGVTPTLDTSWTRLSVTFSVTNPNTTKLALYGSAVAAAAGRALGLDRAQLTPGAELVPFFYGGKAADTYYAMCDWEGTANQSVSKRTPLLERLPDVLTWRAGQTALDFLAPLVQVAGLRLVCDEVRRWTLRDESYSAPGSLSIRHGVNLIDGTDKISRDSGLWFDAAVTRHTWNDSDGVTQTAIDAYALADPYTRLMTFERTTPYPGPGFSEYAVRRAQGRGREVSATIVSDWRASAEQPVTVVMENTPTQSGATQRIEFDLDRDEMTVTSRTTDTPETAWILLPDGESWEDSPPGENWTEE